jgi:hypothetical protein
MRVRRICSKEEDFDAQSLDLSKYFRRQHYPRYLVERQRRKVKSMPRKELLHKKTEKVETERIVCPIMYHQTNLPICKTIKRNYAMLENDDEVGHIFKEGKPMMAYRRDKNLRDLLVHSRLQSGNKLVGTVKCNRTRCNTCEHVSSDKVVVGPKGSFKIRQAFTYK